MQAVIVGWNYATYLVILLEVSSAIAIGGLSSSPEQARKAKETSERQNDHIQNNKPMILSTVKQVSARLRQGNEACLRLQENFIR